MGTVSVPSSTLCLISGVANRDILPFLGKGKGKVKSAYGPMWPTRPELIPVSVA